jgi:peptidylprolyl isomerase
MTIEIPEGYVALDESNNVYKKITVTAPSAATTIRPGSTVKVHYTGSLFPSGEVFDSSVDRGDPFSFKLGKGQVIKGWDVGIASMAIGEHAELLILSDYGYGANGSPPKIPGGATLLFKVELIEVDSSTAEMTISEKIQSSMEAKANANDLFKQSKFEEARKRYQQGLDYLSSTWGAEAEEGKQIKELKVTLNSNLSMCCLKTKDASRARDFAQAVLDIEPDHPKALYRLSQAYGMLGQFESAIDLLNEKKELLKDVQVDQEIVKLKKLKQNQISNEKKMYSKMFG